MGTILNQQHLDERMAELTALLGHYGTGQPSSRPCARCGQHRGRGHKYCAACRQEAKREYMADYHQRTYQPKSAPQVSAGRRGAVSKRWRKDAA